MSAIKALLPSRENQQAYAGKIVQREVFTVPDADGNPIHVERDVVITWETIHLILDMVLERIGK